MKKLRIRFYLLLLAGFKLSAVISQDQLIFEWESISPNEILNDALVEYPTCFFKDSEGLVWFSSTKGLFKFDGFRAHKFKGNAVSDALEGGGLSDFTLGENIQGEIFESPVDQSIWFSTFIGLNRYDRTTGKFEHIQVRDSVGKSLKSHYRMIHLGNSHWIYFKVEKWIYRLSLETDEIQNLGNFIGVNFESVEDDLGNLTELITTSWMDNFGFFSYRFNRNDARVFKTKHYSLKNNSSAVVYDVKRIDDKYTIFSNTGVHEYLPDSSLVNPLPLNGTFRTGIQLTNENLLLARLPTGAELLTKIDGSFLDTKSYEIEHLNEYSISSFYLDSKEVIWIGHDGNKAVMYAWLNKNHFIKPDLNQFNDGTSISSIKMYDEDKLLISNFNGAIAVVDANLNLIQELETTTKFSSKGVRELEVAKSKEIYALTYSALRLFNENFEPKWSYSFPNRLLSSMKLLGDNQVLLLNASQILLAQLFDNAQYEIIDSINVGKSLDLYKLFSFGEESFCVLSDGMIKEFYLHPESGILMKGKEKNFDAQVWSITSGENEEMMLATSTGVFSYDHHQIIESGDYFPWLGNIEYYGAFDAGNGLWYYPTNKGLIASNSVTNKKYLFREEDGLPSSTFSLNGHLKLPNGDLLLNTENGPFVFNPKEIIPYDEEPIINIYQVENVNQKSYSELNPNYVLDYDLKHNQNDLIINAVASGFYNNELNLIKYQLEGHDPDWQYNKNGELIRYFDLNPGDYLLKLQGINANGVFGPMKTINFDISLPWWKTWWFMLAASAGLIASIALIVRSYYRRKLKEQQVIMERQLALQEERSRIASELHDDLGSNLSSIRFMSSLVKRKIEDDSSKERLERIFFAAGDLMEKMEDIVWATDPENDTLENLLINIREYSSKFMETHEIAYQFDFPQQVSQVNLSGQKRRNVLLVIKELLHNIAKHANATHVIFSASVNENVVHLTIKDNGIGFDLKQKINTGNGLKNIQKRMESIQGTFKYEFPKSKGTYAKLDFPLTVET